jgi:predicted O-methyltransferase YrrM
MRDKFIALEQDKCHFIYQLARTLNATTIVEAGTSFGVSTIYLALAVTDNLSANAAAHGKATVIATEYEPAKAEQARKHWAECGESISSVIDLREGDLREMLKTNLPDQVDMLLLDSKFLDPRRNE